MYMNKYEIRAVLTFLDSFSFLLVQIQIQRAYLSPWGN